MLACPVPQINVQSSSSLATTAAGEDNYEQMIDDECEAEVEVVAAPAPENVYGGGRDDQRTGEACDRDTLMEQVMAEVQPRTAEEVEVMREFVEATKRAKFLYDGLNLIKIKPKKANTLKAVVGKALWMHKRIQNKSGRTKVDSSKFDGYLHQYANACSNVPDLVELIVAELYSREDLKNIYKTDADQGEVKKLKRAFKMGQCQSLTGVDTHVLAQTLVSFLKDLKEPVVPRYLWKDFVIAGQIPCMETKVQALQELIGQMPLVNRKTLGVIMQHLQNLTNNNCLKNKTVNMAMFFAPILIGYTSADQECSCDEEAVLVYNAMHALLFIDYQFIWELELC